MRVVVVGGGFAGMASAARLAKIGHQVTLLERSDRLGGALGTVRVGDFAFDTGPTHTLLPAVARDLFRKTGRPLEREVELVPVPVIREHRFADGSRLALTGGSRAAQMTAFDELAPGLGAEWAAWVDGLGAVWERLRRDYFERPWDPGLAHADSRRLLDDRTSLDRRLREAFTDARPYVVAGHPYASAGHDLRKVPAWLGTTSYVEQKFGAWTVPGGMGTLAESLTARLATRKVDVHLSSEVDDLVLSGDRVVAVRTAGRDVMADAVVCAVDPTRLPALRRLTRRLRSTTLPSLTHLGLAGSEWVDGTASDTTVAPAETVLHGPDTFILRSGGQAPERHRVLTVQHRGTAGTDVLDELATHGIDLRDRVVTRLDLGPTELTELWGGSPAGVLWDGRSTVRRRLGPRTPIAGLYAVGAHAAPGAGLPFTGLSAALVAQAIGPA